MKILLASAALVLGPALASAMCSGHGYDKTVMSCADGMVFDAASGVCVARTTS